MADVGRKNKYATHVQPYLQQIDDWLNDGASEEQVAKKLGIAYSTFNKYKTEYEELKLLCEKPRSKLVDELKSALVKKALGFTRTVQRAMKLKETTYDNGKKVKEVEKIVYYDEEVYYPPETPAIVIALRVYDKEGRADYDIQTQTVDIRKEELELRKNASNNDKW